MNFAQSLVDGLNLPGSAKNIFQGRDPRAGWVSTGPMLGPQDYRDLLYHIDHALLVFFRANKLLTASEIRSKSMLSALKSEVERQLRIRMSGITN